MKSPRSGTALALLLALALNLANAADTPAKPQATAPAAAELQVKAAAFGMFGKNAEGKPQFTQGPYVPRVEGQAYGWFIKLEGHGKQVRWREEFTMPVAPKSWGAPETQGRRTVSADGRTAITERTVVPEQGMIVNIWEIGKGDPPGKYRIQVFVEGKPAGTFDFEVR